MKYKVTMEKRKFIQVIVDAKNMKEAEMKAYEGDDEEAIESEFFLPSTDWRVTKIEKSSA